MGWALAATVLISACGAGGIRRFPLAEPMERDEEDFRAFAPMPEEYFSPFGWDAADQMVFRPVARFFAVDPGGEAVNVNAMDEVPDSSWFENRLSRGDLDRAALLRGACVDAPLHPEGPWTITAAKPNGYNPGFIIEDAEGRKFLLKFDDTRQPERATGADVLGSLIYWGAGFHVPCNRAVFFEREILRIEEGTTVDIAGTEVPLTWELLAPAFTKAVRLPDGRLRATSSQFLPGRPLGPWRYEGTREDDPNDVIPHEDRRELRGGYVLASWINHFDAREQNTLAMWIAGEDGRGHVRHNYIDFGDSFGSLWEQGGISRQLGHESYFDLAHFFEDLLTFGAIPRPWRRNEYGPTGEILGYFDVDDFDPERYATGYPNPAFGRATERDNAWMARILTGFDDELVKAIVDAGAFQRRLVRDELVRVLRGRRDKILRRWLRRLSPLTAPTVRGGQLCLRDLAVSAGLIEPARRAYWKRAWRAEGDAAVAIATDALERRAPNHVCLPLPDAGGTEDTPTYLIVDIAGIYAADDDESRPARVHLYQLGDSYRVVGLERPYGFEAPG